MGVLKVSAERANEFLQGQMTCDFRELSNTRSLPGAQCNPKGRMLNTFRALQLAEQQILLTMSADLVASTHSTLNKFAPFFKAQLEDASQAYAQLGLCGPEADKLLASCFPNLPIESNDMTQQGDCFAVKVANNCWLIVVPFAELENYWSTLTQKAQPAGTQLWQLQMIQLGLGQVVEATFEMFIPQMLNLQAAGAISFKKGCYTGQEVVARMKYLGKLKRRMYHLVIDAPVVPVAGSACKLTEEGQSVGNIVSSVQVDSNKVEALVVLTAEAAAAERIIIGSEPPATFLLSPLPYTLESD